MRDSTTPTQCGGERRRARNPMQTSFDPRALLGAGALILCGLTAAFLPTTASASATLQVLKGSGEFKTLATEIAVTQPTELLMQWSTDQAGATGGNWQVTTMPAGSRIASVVASGESSPVPRIPGSKVWFTIPAYAFLPPSTASTLTFNIKITPHDAANNPLGSASPAVVVTQWPVAQGPLFGSANYPKVEIVTYDEKLGPEYAGADVTVRVINKSASATVPAWLHLNDKHFLMRQNTSKLYVPSLAAGASQLVSVHLDAVLPLAEPQYAKWSEQYRNECGVQLTSVLDFAGPLNEAPANAYVEVPLVKEGWSDYANGAVSNSICDGNQCVNVCKLEKDIRARLDGRVVGYSFFAGQYPKFASGGLARTAANAPEQAFTSSTKIPVASVAKFVTAVGAMAILDKYGVSLGAPIGPYLPSDWSSASNYIKGTTFAQLLGQRSGIKDYGNVKLDYAQLKTFFTQGVNSNASTMCGVNPSNPISGNKEWCYSNYNFAIMQILLPKVAGFVEDPNQATRPQTLTDQYVSLVQKNVFDKVDQLGVSCKQVIQQGASESNFALAYAYPGTAAATDWGHQCDGAGWYLSAEDLAKVLMSLNAKDGKILSASPDRFKLLRDAGLGVDVSTEFKLAKAGGQAGFGGSVSTSATVFGPLTGPRVLAVLFINSDISGGPNAGGNAQQVLDQAYFGSIYTK